MTEHNLVVFLDGDNEQLMTKAVNAFYLAETIGQMATNGVTIANQWNLANGRGANGTDYGLIDAQTHQRSPRITPWRSGRASGTNSSGWSRTPA